MLSQRQPFSAPILALALGLWGASLPVTPSLAQTPPRSLQTACGANQLQQTWETNTYYLAICRHPNLANRFFLVSINKRSKTLLRLPAIATSRGYEALDGSTLYLLDATSYQIQRAGRTLLSERVTGTSQPVNPLDGAVLSLTQAGRGTLSLDGRAYRALTTATVSLNRGGNADLTFATRDGGTVRFSGRLLNNTGRTLLVDIKRGNEGRNSGTFRIDYEGTEIRTISASGTVDRQRFTLAFSGLPSSPAPTPAPTPTTLPATEPLALSQFGRGVFAIEGRANRTVDRASIAINTNNTADLAFRLGDSTLVRFSGRLVRRDASTMDIELANAGSATTSGTARVEYGANNSIKAVYMDGRLDNQRFSLDFFQ